jgi:hypothetical protein
MCAKEDGCLVLFIKERPSAFALGRSAGFTRYFFAGASAGAEATTLAPPLRKFFTQEVFKVRAKCTLNEATATAAMNTGIPTEGFTTHHIFE